MILNVKDLFDNSLESYIKKENKHYKLDVSIE
jgi:hypothetical protein